MDFNYYLDLHSFKLLKSIMLYYEKTSNLKHFISKYIHKFVVCCLLRHTIPKGPSIDYVTPEGLVPKIVIRSSKTFGKFHLWIALNESMESPITISTIPSNCFDKP